MGNNTNPGNILLVQNLSLNFQCAIINRDGRTIPTHGNILLAQILGPVVEIYEKLHNYGLNSCQVVSVGCLEDILV